MIIQELHNRFPEKSTELLRCIACLDPKNCFSKFDSKMLLHLAAFYPNDFSNIDLLMLKDELGSFISYVQHDERFSTIETLGSLAQKMVETEKHIIFSMVYRLIERALLLPVATATVERVFSAMKLVKTELRNRMGDEWMNDCLVVYIEKEIFQSIDNERILQYFQNMETRQFQLSRLPSSQQDSTSNTCSSRIKN